MGDHVVDVSLTVDGARSKLPVPETSMKVLLGKLGHPLPEVRCRSLRSLKLKMEHGLLRLADAAEEEYLLRQLLEWFNREGCQQEEEVLGLLAQLAQRARARLLLCDLGALDFLETMRAHSPARLHPPIDKLAAVLLSNPQPHQPDTTESANPSRAGPALAQPLHTEQDSRHGAPSFRVTERRSGQGAPSDRASLAPGVTRPPVATKTWEEEGGELLQNPLSLASILSRPPAQRGVQPEPQPQLRPHPPGRFKDPPKLAEEPLPDLWLPEVPLRPSDDQYLFELNLKLQCIGDPRIVRAALAELCNRAVHDLPPEALLQKHPILDSVLSLAHPVGSPGDLDIAALNFVAALVKRTGGALRLSRDESFAVHLGGESEPSNVSPNHPTSFLRSSYPIAKRARTSKGEAFGKLRGRIIGERVVDVSKHTHEIAMHMLKLLALEKRLERAVGILRELLPLLRPQEEGHGEKLGSKTRVRFAQYFHIVTDALHSHTHSSPSPLTQLTGVTPPADADLASAAAALPPFLVVLSVGCALVRLLPATSVGEIVPAALAEAIGAVARDEVLAACVTGVRTEMLPYLAVLDPRLHQQLSQAQYAYSASKAAASVLSRYKNPDSSREADPSPESVEKSGSALEALETVLAAVSSLAFSGDEETARQMVALVKRVLRERSLAEERRIPGEKGALPAERGGTAAERRASTAEGERSFREEQGNEPSTSEGRRSDVEASAESDVSRVDDGSRSELTREGRTGEKEGGQSSDGPEATGHAAEFMRMARGVILRLITHESARIRRAAYEGLLKASTGNGRQSGEEATNAEVAFVGWLAASNEVVVEVLTRGIHQESTAEPAAALFLHLVDSVPPSERARFASARPWLSGCLDLPRATSAAFAASGLITRSLESAVTQARIQNATGGSLQGAEEAPGKERRIPGERISGTEEAAGGERGIQGATWQELEWEELRWKLMGLLSKNPAVRAESSADVRDSLKELGEGLSGLLLGGGLAEDGSEDVSDPFRDLLVDVQALGDDVSTEVVETVPARELPAATRRDAESLLAIVRSPHVEDAIRRSALEQLRASTADRRLETLLAEDERLLELLVGETLKWAQDWGSPLDCLELAEREVRGEERGSGGFGLSALGLLARLSSSKPARKWLLGDPTARIHPLLPLVFHPTVEVRRELGALLTALLFSADELLTSLGSAGTSVPVTVHIPPAASEAIGDSEPRTPVPLPLLASFAFPCPVVPARVAGSLPEDNGERPELQKVKRLLEQMRLLEDGPIPAWEKVERKRGAGGDLSLVERQAWAAVPGLLPEKVFDTILRQNQEAQSHDDCRRALASLSLHVIQHPLRARLLAQAPWPPALQRFLSVPPISEEDQSLACLVLNHILTMLRLGAMPSGGLLLLARIARDVSIPLLARSWGEGEVNGLRRESETEARRREGKGGLRSGRGSGSDWEAAPPFSERLLEFVVELLTSAGGQGSRHVAAQVCEALLISTGFVERLVAIARSERSPMGMRCLALRGLEATAALVPHSRASEALQKQVCESVIPLVNLVISLSGQPKDDAPPPRRALLKQGLLALRAVTVSAGPRFWDRGWARTGATFWLSRLGRDHEASVRASAFALLASAASEEAPGTRHMLGSYWPEVAHVAAKAALDVRECYAVRQEALQFIAMAGRAERSDHSVGGVLTGEERTAQAAEGSGDSNRGNEDDVEVASAAPEQPHAEGAGPEELHDERAPLTSAPLTEISEGALDRDEASFLSGVPERGGGLGLESALRREGFWERLPGLVLEKDATAGFLRALTSLLAALTSEALLDVLEVPAMWPRLLQLLKVPTVGKAQEALCESTGFEGRVLGMSGLLDRVASAGHVAEVVARVGHVSERHRAMLMGRLGAVPALAESFCAVSKMGKKWPTEVEASMSKEKWLLERERAVALESLASALSAASYWKASTSASSGLFCKSDTWPSESALRKVVAATAELLTDEEEGAEGARKAAERNGNGGKKDDVTPVSGLELAVCRLVASLLTDGPAAAKLLGKETDSGSGAPDSGGPRNGGADSGGTEETAAKRSPQFDGDNGLGGALFDGLLPLYREVRRRRIEALSLGKSSELLSCSEAFAAVGGALRALVAFSKGAKARASENAFPATLLENARDTQALLRLESLHLPLPNQGALRQHRREGAVVTVTSAGPRKKGPVPHGAQRAPQRKRADPPFARPSETEPDGTSSRPQSGAVAEGAGGEKVTSDVTSGALLEDLLLSLSLLKHLAYGSAEAAEAILDAGALTLVRDTWNYAQAEGAVLHEILGVLCNLAAVSEVARRAIALEGQPIIGGGGGKATVNKGLVMLGVVKLLGRPSLGGPLFLVAMQLMQSLVMSPEPRTALLRTSFLIDAHQTLQRAVATKDLQKQDAILNVLANLAAFSDGQRALLKSLALSGLFDLVLDIAASSPGSTAASALLLLRNLAFAHENKVHFLSSPRALPVLLTAVTDAAPAGTNGARTPKSAVMREQALAASALWALAYNDQRVVAALRSADALPKLEGSLRSLRRESGARGRDVNKHAEEALEKVVQLMR
ncbi:hypothetical protein KFL_001840060 [Klebsormidium nitens]|uniref:Rotatin N-terminal domain-containing protein n=1 Tax=Klebsormidium nitens TaxID=105231 RepID=A0A1Y1I6G1_KLENI|nr:hypothetical protein KFL_001840060 [Klebsormidium nitens]|eukprot:GAQ84307.1 hypothetical protein KFL_001840060 [Klebsormidium nitens]